MNKIGTNIVVILIVLLCIIIVSATPVWFWILIIIFGFRKEIKGFILQLLKKK